MGDFSVKGNRNSKDIIPSFDAIKQKEEDINFGQISSANVVTNIEAASDKSTFSPDALANNPPELLSVEGQIGSLSGKEAEQIAKDFFSTIKSTNFDQMVTYLILKYAMTMSRVETDMNKASNTLWANLAASIKPMVNLSKSIEEHKAKADRLTATKELIQGIGNTVGGVITVMGAVGGMMSKPKSNVKLTEKSDAHGSVKGAKSKTKSKSTSSTKRSKKEEHAQSEKAEDAKSDKKSHKERRKEERKEEEDLRREDKEASNKFYNNKVFRGAKKVGGKLKSVASFLGQSEGRMGQGIGQAIMGASTIAGAGIDMAKAKDELAMVDVKGLFQEMQLNQDVQNSLMNRMQHTANSIGEATRGLNQMIREYVSARSQSTKGMLG